MDRDTNRPKGFGFVEMGSDQEGPAAIRTTTRRTKSRVLAAERVTDEESFRMAGRLLREEGLLVGG
jgi:cysteine synthase